MLAGVAPHAGTARWPGVPLAIAAAVLFGASTPLAKLLLGEGVDPWLLAGLLYLGSGVGLSLIHLTQRARGVPRGEAPLRRPDLPRLALVVLAGGLAGPLLLMLGLRTTLASTASLLLNLEGLATMAIAWVVFRENVDRRLLAGAAAILAGAAIVSWEGGPNALGMGALFISAACIGWGLDNNLTRTLSAADPVQIAAIKGLVAGSVNLTLALLAGASVGSVSVALWAGVVGFLGYGISLVFFTLSLRHLGTARTGAYFSIAPFVGAAVSIPLFDEALTLPLLVAASLMGLGLYLHLVERHDHEHAHGRLEHEHRHVHDEHHQHEHDAAVPHGEAHSHRHVHAGLVHRHRHYPDLHHRHGHGD
jgi:drug/metabolite transporter (DMT)-like permease